MLRLKLNYNKSNIITWRKKDKAWAMNIAERLCCRLCKCPTTYLGLPVGANMSISRSREPVILKIKVRTRSLEVKVSLKGGKGDTDNVYLIIFLYTI